MVSEPESVVLEPESMVYGVRARVFGVRARVFGVRAKVYGSFVILVSALSPYFGLGLGLWLGLDNKWGKYIDELKPSREHPENFN